MNAVEMLPILVNRRHGLLQPPQQSSMREFSHAGFTIQLEANTHSSLTALMDDINAWDKIAAISGYRSSREQQTLYSYSLLENGSRFTEKYVALPGHSEHETGLAVDMALIMENMDALTPHFPYEGICQRFRDNAPDHGFILRYPAGKEHITGIAHEPWHFRFVSLPHSLIIAMNGMSLEEYLGDRP